jgi:hypothetical protein
MRKAASLRRNKSPPGGVRFQTMEQLKAITSRRRFVIMSAP